MIPATLGWTTVEGHSPGTEGFTLVEMLVALSLTALLSGLLMAAVVQIRPIQTITASMEGEAELIGVADYLKDLFGEAQKITLLGSDPDRKAVFGGQTSSARFVAVARAGSKRNALRDVEILVRSNDGGFDLVQRQSARRVISPPPAEDFTIVRRLKSVSLEYLGRAREVGWQKEWADREALPFAVRLRLVAERAGREITVEETAILSLK